MALKFVPRSPEQLEADKAERLGLLPVAEYAFEITFAQEKTSRRNKKPMLHVQLAIIGPKGDERIVDDYIVVEDIERLFEFTRAVGMEAQYSAGEFEARDCRFRKGRARIGIGRATQYLPIRNVVLGYLQPPR